MLSSPNTAADLKRFCPKISIFDRPLFAFSPLISYGRSDLVELITQNCQIVLEPASDHFVDVLKY
ncbi:hypothetical protein D0N37_10325 [Pseudoalteromonas piscicida]|nr:hypothetical protein D0N37_10325 [Pseudoalteromonas piscicida]